MPFTWPKQFLNQTTTIPVLAQYQIHRQNMHTGYPTANSAIATSINQKSEMPSTETNGTHASHPVPNGTTRKTLPVTNEWTKPGPNAYDFFSDTITTPTLSMLTAITNTTLTDDVYTGDPTTQSLESHLATLAGQEAGLLVMSGTMGNQVAIRSHLTYPPHSVLCDIRSHIANYEAGGISTLSGAHLITVTPSNNHHLTLEDIQSHAIISDDIHHCPTRIISLENTLNGLIMPLSEVRRISTWCKSNNILLHLDGARIWEAVVATNTSLTEYCAPFNSISMCLSKGLGAPIGSVLVGSTKFITQARRIRKMLGGGTRQSGIIAAAARVAVDENFGLGAYGEGGKLGVCHERAKRVARCWEGYGGKLVWPVETNMVWLDLKSVGDGVAEELKEVAAEEGVKFSGRLVVHYQIAEEAIVAVERVFERVMKGKTV